MALIRINQGELAFGHVPLLDGVSFNVEPRERLCLIGRNGSGKSSLLNVLAGEQALDAGVLWRRDGLRIGKLAQEVPDAEASTLFEVVAAGLGDFSDLLSRYHRASQQIAEAGNQVSTADLEAFGRLQEQIEHAGGWEGSQRIDEMISRLALPADAPMAECSGGIRRRAMLGQALVSQPDLLLLDEPTNHLDIESIEALEDAILDYPGAVLFVSHDRTFVDRLASRIVELDRGALRSFPGNYAAYLTAKAALLDAQENADRKFDQTLAEEEVWIRQGIKARRTRNEGRVRRLEAMRRERSERIERPGSVDMNLASGERSGKLVVEAENVSFGYAGPPIIDDFSTLILRGDRIGIIGRNGSGKSTLLKLLLGALEPAAGSIRVGSKLAVAYFDQERQQLDEERSVRDNLAEGSDYVEIDGKRKHVISYLADFLFPAARAGSPVKALSGGERNRLLLARLFARPANLLVLDEPTNDLDVETLELLEELLNDYTGTLLLVSHDRSFIDRTVTSTLVLNGDGRIEEHVGGYSDWQAYVASSKRDPGPPGKPRPAPTLAASSAQPNRTDQVRKPQADRTSNSKPDKLSYKQQRELAALPDRIESLEQRQHELQAVTADAEFYQRSKPDIAAVMDQLAAVAAELEGAYQRWEELESTRNPD